MPESELTTRLMRVIDEVDALQSKLIVVVGTSGSGKTSLLRAISKDRHLSVLNVGRELAGRLAFMALKQRPLQAKVLLDELAVENCVDNLLLLDNVEVLFDGSLHLDPLDLLKRLAHARRVVAIWPGELRDNRLLYAEIGHPEHQDYGLGGLVPFGI